MFRILTFLTLCFVSVNIISQEDIYFEDFVYVDNIKSVKFNPLNDITAFPITKLNGGQILHLGFDDLDAVDKRYTYSLIHCDKNWNQSELDEMEYIDGFNGEEINDSYHSVSTKIDYVHYDLYLPNDYARWIISGNYLLVIYDEDGQAVISKRFLVVEPQVSVYAEFTKPRKISQLKTHQNLEININFEDFYIRDPLNELSVSVLQNFRWMDAIQDIKPKNAVSNQLTFDVFNPFKFPAYKEFRNFDIRSLMYTSRFVYSIKASPYEIDVLLEKDKKRTYTNFISDPDLNGNFITGNEDDPYGIQSAEYVNVGFTLESPLPFEDHDIYVIGGFSDWQIYESNKMAYNTSSYVYEADILFKQGFYDYYYALVDEDVNIDLQTLEGNWYETDNSYYILVYLREFGSYYDKLIAMYTLK